MRVPDQRDIRHHAVRRMQRKALAKPAVQVSLAVLLFAVACLLIYLSARG